MSAIRLPSSSPGGPTRLQLTQEKNPLSGIAGRVESTARENISPAGVRDEVELFAGDGDWGPSPELGERFAAGIEGQVTGSAEGTDFPSGFKASVSGNPSVAKRRLKLTREEDASPAVKHRMRLTKLAASTSPIWMGTQNVSQGERVSREHTIKNRGKMETAFLALKGKLQEVYPDMQHLTIDLETLSFTIHNSNRTEEVVGYDQIREELARTTGQKQTAVNEDVAQLIDDLRTVAKNSGLYDLWPYSSRGEEERGCITAEKPMHSSLTTVQNKHIYNLEGAVKTNKHSLEKLIEHAKRKKISEKQITERILYAEAFQNRLCKKLGEKIALLQPKVAKANPKKKKKLEKTLKDLELLKKRIESETHRHALYYAAVFSDENGQMSPQARKNCYYAICHDLHEAANEQVKKQKSYYQSFKETVRLATEEPSISFPDFMESRDGALAKEYAVDVLSTLAPSAKFYKKLCEKAEVPLKQDHVNVFLMQALKRGKKKNTPIQFNPISIGFDRDTQEIVDQLIKKTHSEVSKAFKTPGFIGIHAKKLPAMERLEAALKAPSLKLLLT